MAISAQSRSHFTGLKKVKRPATQEDSEVIYEGNRILNFVVLVHIVAITIWASPFDLPLSRDVKEFARAYLVWSGLFQSWDTFAPNPKSDNSYIKALVVADHYAPQI